jgi:hypothetical protein
LATPRLTTTAWVGGMRVVRVRVRVRMRVRVRVRARVS